jgi:hypothetical protein
MNVVAKVLCSSLHFFLMVYRKDSSLTWGYRPRSQTGRQTERNAPYSLTKILSQPGLSCQRTILASTTPIFFVESFGAALRWFVVFFPMLPHLAQVQMKVDAVFVKDTLLGDDATEIRVKLIEILSDKPPPGDE